MGRKLFYLSLIVLSVLMGLNWYKNRPTVKKVRPKKTVQVPVDLDATAQEPGSGEGEEGEDETASGTASATVAVANASGTTEVASASGSAEVATPTAVVASETPPVKAGDPVLLAYDELGSTTFDLSPFTLMMAEAGKVADASGEVKTNVKTTKMLAAPFGGLIEVGEELQAIIGTKIYKEGGEYEGKTVKKVEPHLVTLEDANGIYLIQKKGIEGRLASDGTYTFLNDSYHPKY